MTLRDHLLTLEDRLLEPSFRRDMEALNGLLADEFREFGSSGRTYTKREIIDLLASEPPRDLALHDFACRALSPETALVTYRSRSDAGEALRSSIWIYRGGQWRMLFHQGTKVPASPKADAVS